MLNLRPFLSLTPNRCHPSSTSRQVRDQRREEVLSKFDVAVLAQMQ